MVARNSRFDIRGQQRQYRSDDAHALRTGERTDLLGHVRAVLHTEQHFPSERGMQFPTGEPMLPSHLDVRLNCRLVGASYSGNLIIWYFLDK
jgi:hypothetical protein